jgi:hypothetical protein
MSLPPCHVSLLPVRVSLSCLSTVHCSVLPGYVCLPLSSPSPAHRQFQTPPSRGVYLSLTCPRAPPARAVSIPHLGAPLPWPSGFTCATAAIAQQFTHVLENLLHRISPAPVHAADTSPQLSELFPLHLCNLQSEYLCFSWASPVLSLQWGIMSKASARRA